MKRLFVFKVIVAKLMSRVMTDVEDVGAGCVDVDAAPQAKTDGDAPRDASGDSSGDAPGDASGCSRDLPVEIR